jgi:hypothetical protein
MEKVANPSCPVISLPPLAFLFLSLALLRIQGIECTRLEASSLQSTWNS